MAKNIKCLVGYFFLILRIECWLSPGYSVLIDIIRSMSMGNWFIGIVREQVSAGNKCFDQLIPHSRHSERSVLRPLIFICRLPMCNEFEQLCYPQNIYLSSCVKNYSHNFYYSIELSIGCCLESQVNGNEPKLRVSKCMSEIDI